MAGVYAGVYNCLHTLIPSLFPFVLLACVFSTSTGADFIFRPLSPILRHAFRLPSAAAPALVLGLTAGYPVGAKMTARLLQDGRLTREQAGRLLCFCTAPGYAFAAVYTGGVLLGRPHTGLLLFAACSLAPLLLGLTLARFAPRVVPEATPPRRTGDFTRAVHDGVSAMVTLSAFVIVFTALLSVLHDSGLFQRAANGLARLGFSVPGAGAAIAFFFEVTAGVTHSAHWHLSPAITAFGLGFGGLCIHLQLFSFFSDTGLPLSRFVYLLTRVLNGVLAAAAYRFLSFLFPSAETAAALVSGGAVQTAAGSAAGSIAVLALSLFFLALCAKRSPRTDLG